MGLFERVIRALIYLCSDSPVLLFVRVGDRRSRRCTALHGYEYSQDHLCIDSNLDLGPAVLPGHSGPELVGGPPMTAPLYTQAEASAALAALKTLEQADVPWYAQSQISDQLLVEIVSACLNAAAQVRAKPQGT